MSLMKRRMTGLAVATSLVAPAVSFAGGYGMQHVNAQSVYLRTYPQSYAIGTLYYGEHFEVQYITPEGWAWGYAFGSFNGCAWTDISYLVKHEGHQKATDCGEPRRLPTP